LRVWPHGGPLLSQAVTCGLHTINQHSSQKLDKHNLLKYNDMTKHNSSTKWGRMEQNCVKVRYTAEHPV